MRVSIVLDHRFLRSSDGKVWTTTCFSSSHWRRYLAVFDEVRVVARVRQVSGTPVALLRADGAGITFADAPNYRGPFQYLRQLQRLRRFAAAGIHPRDAVILRVPSPLTWLVWPTFTLDGRPYGVEVVGDPYEVFAPCAMQHPLRFLFRQLFFRLQRWQCANAATATYVTTKILQARYPSCENRPTFSYSDVELPEPAFATAPRHHAETKSAFTILFVGSLAQLYKGPDVLIDAAARLRKHLRLTLLFVGDGRYRPELERRAEKLGIRSLVRFLGELPAGEAVRAQMDAADLFVLPSRTEGLPRAMIEAMARAMPCIGAAVGGIPELLPADDLVVPGQVAALADRILEVLRDPARMNRMSQDNWQKARNYEEEKRARVRRAFYQEVRRATEQWTTRRTKYELPDAAIDSEII